MKFADMTTTEAKAALEAVVYSERIPAAVKILPNNTVSVQPLDFPQYGQKFRSKKSLREAAWKASLFISKLREQIDTEKELIDFAERYGIYEQPLIHFSGLILLAGQRYQEKNLHEAKQLAMTTIKRLWERKQSRRR